ncbi:transposase [Adhaeribacter soli]|uniref:Transposase n=1 Tax=Adhaeribacter soli TaxID=2607655 RepID=A0A5N1IJW8_9BACT|nr:transposase [Adhaeribacter soli]KAA9326043.1 transposase [Adhaeribacter soli]
MELSQVYFWTSTILDWKPLLLHHTSKAIIVNSLKHLHAKGKIRIYGFVIMPNHVHLLWEMIAMNGKEMPYASFQKFTAHEFQKELRSTNPSLLSEFEVDEPERKYRFWQRDPLAFPVNSKTMAEQKLQYLHLNPLQAHWNLAKRPEAYMFSSARFYESMDQEFNFLTDYRERF